jgi:hypothetical protein
VPDGVVYPPPKLVRVTTLFLNAECSTDDANHVVKSQAIEVCLFSPLFFDGVIRVPAGLEGSLLIPNILSCVS